MDTVDIIIFALPVALAALIIFSAPTSLEKANARRAAKGRAALTENEYQQKLKRERIISFAILGVAFVIANTGRILISHMFG